MGLTYKQSCKINPTEIDFSAFEKKDIQKEQFASSELYEAGITNSSGQMQKIITYIRSDKLKNVRIAVICIVLPITIIILILNSMSHESFAVWLDGMMLIFLLVVLAVVGACVLGRIEDAGQKIQLRWLMFARQNGFKYHIGASGNNSPQALAFQIGYDGTVSNTLDLDSRLSVVEYTYKTKYGDEEVLHHLNFARFRLQNGVPHLVLDSKFSALQIKGPQEIRLEGNFQDHFTLYAPDGFHIDALQIFTPDVMGKLLDQEGKYDLELVGSDLYIYEVRQGLIESGLTIDALANTIQDRERHSRFINFLSSVVEIASEIDEQTHRYVNTHTTK